MTLLEKGLRHLVESSLNERCLCTSIVFVCLGTTYHSELYSCIMPCLLCYSLSCRYHARCTMSFAPEMLGDVFFVGLKHVSVHVILHPRRGIRDTYKAAAFVHATDILVDHYRHREKSRCEFSSQSPRMLQAPSIIIFSSCQITPQSLSFPRKSHNPLHTALLPPPLSSAPHLPPPAASPLTRAGSTRARASLPTPSVYIHDPRERSRRYFSI